MNDDIEELEWKYSSIRSWLNTELYKNSFSKEEKQRIQTCMTDFGNILGCINGGSIVYDKFFA